MKNMERRMDILEAGFREVLKEFAMMRGEVRALKWAALGLYVPMVGGVVGIIVLVVQALP